MVGTKCDNIVFLELERHNALHLVRYSDASSRALSPSEDYLDVIRSDILGNGSNRSGTTKLPIKSQDGSLSIKAPKDKAVFLVSLTKLGFVSFGPGSAPVQSFCKMLPPGFEAISDVKLYFMMKDGKVEAVGSDTDWARPQNGAVGHANWASFVCDANIVKSNPTVQAVQKEINSDEFELPLYYNLFVGDYPNWMLANMHPPGHSHGHDHDHDHAHSSGQQLSSNKKVESHGGVHPTADELALMSHLYSGKSFKTEMERATAMEALLSHGGVHPGIPQNSIGIDLGG